MKHSLITRKKMSASHKGKNIWSKGRKLSEEHKNKISATTKGRKGVPHSAETKAKLSLLTLKNTVRYWKGKKRLHMLGDKHPMWQGGITPINKIIRGSLEYKLWRTAVFERDNYQCIWGGKAHGSKLHADHIKSFAFYPELRFAIDNGRSLCEACHATTDTYKRRIKL